MELMITALCKQRSTAVLRVTHVALRWDRKGILLVAQYRCLTFGPTLSQIALCSHQIIMDYRTWESIDEDSQPWRRAISRHKASADCHTCLTAVLGFKKPTLLMLAIYLTVDAELFCL
jgi:hypothetical protein